MEVRRKSQLSLFVLALLALSLSILIVSGEARRGGARRAKVFGDPNRPVTTDEIGGPRQGGAEERRVGEGGCG